MSIFDTYADEAARLKAARVARRVTVADLAAELGWGYRTIYRVESGERLLSQDEHRRWMSALDACEAAA